MGNGFLAGIYLAAAAAPILYAVRLFRRHPSPSLLSYTLYLAFWNIQNVFAAAFLLYSQYLPKAGRLGFILFNGVILIPVQAATVILYADFLWKTMGWRRMRAIGAVLSAPFLVILAVYARQAFSRLSNDPAPVSLQINAPLSGSIMLGIILASAGTGFLISIFGKRIQGKKGVPVVMGLTAAGLIILIPAMRIDFSGFGGFILSGFIWLAANIPAFLVLASMIRWKRDAAVVPETPGSRLKEIADRFGLSEREREVLEGVLRGRLNKEIAAELFVSLETVKKHLYNIFKKTSVRSRLQLFLLFQGKEPPETRE